MAKNVKKKAQLKKSQKKIAIKAKSRAAVPLSKASAKKKAISSGKKVTASKATATAARSHTSGNKKVNSTKNLIKKSDAIMKSAEREQPSFMMKAPRQALGRGLSALLSTSPVPVRPAENTEHLRPVPLVEPTTRAWHAEVISQDETMETQFEVRDSVIEAIHQIDSEEEEAEEVSAFSAHNGHSQFGNGLSEVDLVSSRSTQEVRFLPLEHVIASSGQPRKRFVQSEIDTLANSIKESGVLQPILVRKLAGDSLRFEIVAGERRYRAAGLAGLSSIPAIVREFSDKEALEIGIIENIQRENLDPIEEAEAYARLIEEHGETQGSIAASVGKDRASVANALRLLKLPEKVRSMIAAGELSAGHGRAILMVEDEVGQLALAKRITTENLSVRQAEAVASGKNLNPSKEKKASSSNAPSTFMLKTPAALALEDRLRRALGTKVNLMLSKEGAGELKISFFSRAEFESFLERVGA